MASGGTTLSIADSKKSSESDSLSMADIVWQKKVA
jgi:hypothetical protein